MLLVGTRAQMRQLSRSTIAASGDREPGRLTMRVQNTYRRTVTGRDPNYEARLTPGYLSGGPRRLSDPSARFPTASLRAVYLLTRKPDGRVDRICSARTRFRDEAISWEQGQPEGRSDPLDRRVAFYTTETDDQAVSGIANVHCELVWAR